MSPEEEQIDQFNDEIRRVIRRFRLEYDLSVEAMIGAIEFIKSDMLTGTVDFVADFPVDDEEDGGE